MSLRAKILTHSLPLLPTHSFTRQTLALALSRLPSDHPDHRVEPIPDSVLDTLFGDGRAAPKALVQRWEEEGIEPMEAESGSKPSIAGLESRLRSRLTYSAGLGHYLPEAYSILSAPESETSIPIPSIPLPIRQLLRLRLPPIYTPPGLAAHGALSAGDYLSGVAGRNGGRLPIPLTNPIGPMAYAWRIADAAIRADERAEGIKRGVMNEPVGPGPEWYTSRISLALAYLRAESHLLKPYPDLPPNQVYAEKQPNPHLASAHQALERNLQSYRRTRDTVDGIEKGAGSVGGYLEFAARSVGGLWRSRYL
ncbi:uncharacterized protein MKK02DRAFT_44682 [Dioszegia hungarica]|uniref:COQ9 domain-containing protein n=1 Tax=Dioszegia hungarica TaxID=4972 RepID=A0AA38LUV3_9TREE|nr:uncharacterized protein MKK02DRAFT_44682 [Dioszegia hungarica]KAI9635983.1 hypothetical protein MKK02DRAFT_44682 [Dioszegia hungarica]